MSDTDDVWASALRKWTEEAGIDLDKVMRPLPRDHTPPRLADITGLNEDAITVDELTQVPRDEPWSPRLWDMRPDSVTHVAAPAMHIFGIYLRQRCAWCGVVLLEYDLRRVAVPIGTDPMPAMWAPFALVRVDGHMQAEVEEVIEDGNIKLPMDSCTFDPETQVR